MDYRNQMLQVLLIWQFASLSSSQFMPPMPYPGPMGQPGSPQQMQMPPMPQMPMGPMGPMGPLPMMPLGLAQPKLPVVVMPYPKNDKQKKSKNKNRKRNKKHKKSESDSSWSDSSSESDSSSVSSSDETTKSSRRSAGNGKRKHQHHGRHTQQVLTPVISYVTKDGYVVYQKKIKKERARDWLDLGYNKQTGDQNTVVEISSAESEADEATMKQIKQKFKRGQKKHSSSHHKH